MNLTDQQLWTLHQLGIPVWQQRETTSQALTQTNPVETDAPFVCQSDLLLCVPEVINSAEQQLLGNICKVIDGLALSNEQCQPAMLEKLNFDSEWPRQILIFGELPLMQEASFKNRCIRLPSLADLIRETLQKAAVWTVICQLQQQVSQP